MYRIFIHFFPERKLLEVLQKVEFGISTFCDKLAKQAATDGYPELSRMLLEHSKDDSRHGKMIASLLEGTERLPVTGNGRFLSIIRPSGEQIVKSPKQNPKGKKIQWQSTKYLGENLTGIFENFDGISQRYYSLRILFNHQSAFSYDWCDRVCFMHLLEKEAQAFYQILLKACFQKLKNIPCSDESKNIRKFYESLQAIASQIVKDEEGHSEYLKHLIHWFPDADLKKWKSRLFWAKLGLIIDAVKLWQTAN